MSEPRVIALIPARGGSKRIRRKNARHLQGIPLLAYTIISAQQSGIFSGVYVSTEDPEIERIALIYGADVIRRPEALAADDSPDIAWVTHALVDCHLCDKADYWGLLRPTNPLRGPDVIRDAYSLWQQRSRDFDSLRAMELIRDHPAKAWTVDERGYAHPVATFGFKNPPAHSRPYQALPFIYRQTAALEIAHVSTVTVKGSISGDRIMPYLMTGHTGLDLNSEVDWLVLEALLDKGLAILPRIEVSA